MTASQRAAQPGEPIRFCVGCRQHGLRSTLVRIVLPIFVADADAALSTDKANTPVAVVDQAKTMPGRGAWLHHSVDCLNQAKRRQAIPRALRGRAELVEVEKYFTEEGY